MTPWKPSLFMRILQRLCPHVLGWSAVPNGRYRFCRCCSARRRLVGGVWT